MGNTCNMTCNCKDSSSLHSHSIKDCPNHPKSQIQNEQLEYYSSIKPPFLKPDSSQDLNKQNHDVLASPSMRCTIKKTLQAEKKKNLAGPLPTLPTEDQEKAQQNHGPKIESVKCALNQIPDIQVQGEKSMLKSEKSAIVRLAQSSNRNHKVQRTDFVRVKCQKVTDHYQMMKKLGEGSYGNVYKVRSRKTGEERAMKIVKKDDVTDEENIFAQLEILRKMDHPNILKLYEVFEEEDFFYIVTEYCDGGEVLYTLKKLRQFTEKSTAQIMRQIIGAVVYMHKRNIVHRDLKLENILYEHKKMHSKEPPIKIIDFGTSRLTAPDKTLHAKMGSPFYVAPEVLNRHYNIKCDVWSCGIIMYILLCGKPPFIGQTQQQIFENIKKASLTFSEKPWSKISQEAKNLISRMLQRNVEKRISAEEVLASNWINNCSNNEAIDATALRNLENFYFKDKFRAVIMTYLASTAISKEERMALARKFNEIDKDRSGVIERQELIDAYKKVYKLVDESMIERILQTLDTNGSGQIDFTEFIVAASEQEKLMREEMLLNAFEFFDQDGTGFLDMGEIRKMLGDSSEGEVKMLMQELDTNKDNLISKDEFIKKLRSGK